MRSMNSSKAQMSLICRNKNNSCSNIYKVFCVRPRRILKIEILLILTQIPNLIKVN